jgi:hypothetical protein
MTVDPNLTKAEAPQVPQRGGFLGFLSSLPGILTSLATLITAVGGIYLAHGDSGERGRISPNSGETTYNITVAAAPAPSGTAEVNADGLPVVTDSTSVDNQTAQMVSDCAAGSQEACTELLNTLAQKCYAGSGLSCDVLYEVSAAGSDYEAYGATCGARFTDQTYADRCGTL